MHESIRNYVNKIKKMYPERFENTDVLDAGSLDINGSNREFFTNCEYTGVDIGPGKGVDIVCDIKDFQPGKQYDVVISTSMLEHNKTWKEGLMNMYRLLKPFGLMVCTCANINFPEHGTNRHTPHHSPNTNDYYLNLSPDDILSVLPNAIIEEDVEKKDTNFYLIKKR